MWHAETTFEGDTEFVATSDSPDLALMEMLKLAVDAMLTGETLIAGEYLKTLGGMLKEIENDSLDEYHAKGGDFSGGFFEIHCVLK
jgi:hypothetical protein